MLDTSVKVPVNSRSRFQLRAVRATKEDVDRKFHQSTYSRGITAEQQDLNDEMGKLEEGSNGYIQLYICSKSEWDDPMYEDEVRKTVQNLRSMIGAAVKYNNYPRLASGKRYAYQTTVSLEPDGHYWLLVRRLSPMANH